MPIDDQDRRVLQRTIRRQQLVIAAGAAALVAAVPLGWTQPAPAPVHGQVPIVASIPTGGAAFIIDDEGYGWVVEPGGATHPASVRGAQPALGLCLPNFRSHDMLKTVQDGEDWYPLLMGPRPTTTPRGEKAVEDPQRRSP